MENGSPVLGQDLFSNRNEHMYSQSVLSSHKLHPCLAPKAYHLLYQITAEICILECILYYNNK